MGIKPILIKAKHVVNRNMSKMVSHSMLLLAKTIRNLLHDGAIVWGCAHVLHLTHDDTKDQEHAR